MENIVPKKKLNFDLMYDDDFGFGYDKEKDYLFFKNELAKYYPEANFEYLKKGYDFAYEKYQNKFRASGSPYYTHPLTVAILLIRYFKVYDERILVAAFLHDVIEDTQKDESPVSKQDIAEYFNDEDLARIVDAVTKISHDNINEEFITYEIKYGNAISEDVKEFLNRKKIQKALTYRKLFMTLIQDVRVIILKLADRLHNVLTLHYFQDKQKAKDIADETLKFYAGFAYRLGFMNVGRLLQEASFYYFSDEELYEKIRNMIDTKEVFILEQIDNYSKDLNLALSKIYQNPPQPVIYHRKEYEIYNLTNQLQDPDELTDYVECIIPIPENEINSLYHIESALIEQFGYENVFNHSEGKQKIGDYSFEAIKLRVKKPGLESLDITIMNSENYDILENFVKPDISKQILNSKLLEINEKELELWGDWMYDLIFEKGEEAIPEIWNSIQNNVFAEKISVYSVDQKVINLPQNSTVLDFAFAVAGETAINFIGAKISNNTYDYRHRLEGGESVQILFADEPQYSPYWLDYIKDFHAIGILNHYLRNSAQVSNPSILENTQTQVKKNNFAILNNGFIANLLINGIDRISLLNDISKAIGNADIISTVLESNSFDNTFEGTFQVKIKDATSLNALLLNLLKIRSVKSVKILDIELSDYQLQ
ncbi:MAG TPA: HD domain-containing protein [Bacteroidota bacterium]|nr:HD domain-containing protein [Bacteroidota bacterium]